MNDIERDKKIEETHDTVLELKVVLLGRNSDKGLVGLVNSNTRKINRLNIIIAGLIGSGLITSGGIGVAQLLK